MKQWIKEVARGKKGSRDLTYEEARSASVSIIKGEATDAQVSAFLIAERLKTESPEEILAFIHSFREASSTLSLPEEIKGKLIDFAGPYNGRNTFAATIPVSILLAQAGLPVYLHSSDSLPPRKGLAIHQIIDKLGVAVNSTAEEISHSIKTINIGIAKTEALCPPLAAVRNVREEIGVRTFLNTAEKILNLADASSVMMGVFHRTVIDVNAAVLRSLGYNKAFIVQGAEGSEDLPIHRKSFIYEVTKESILTFDVDPNEYGLKHKKEAEKEKLNIEQQNELIIRILSGEESNEIVYYRDQVLWNTGVRYFLFGKHNSIEEGIQFAQQQLEERSGLNQLNLWRGLLSFES